MDELSKVDQKPEEAPTSVLSLPKDDSLVVIASTPGQMANAQVQLAAWFEAKIELCRAELIEIEENLALAKSRKWQTKGWMTRVVKAKQAVEYYEKGKAAIEAGYCIVPDFPVDVIAIRTTLARPRSNTAESYHDQPRTRDQATNSPALGTGKYVSPQATERIDSYDRTKSDGKTEKRYFANAVDFLPPDFPYKMVKPKILEETNRAMALRIFDEIAVVSKPRRAPDPIVVGRITRKINTYHQKTLSFMVAWWLDVRDL